MHVISAGKPSHFNNLITNICFITQMRNLMHVPFAADPSRNKRWKGLNFYDLFKKPNVKDNDGFCCRNCMPDFLRTALKCEVLSISNYRAPKKVGHIFQYGFNDLVVNMVIDWYRSPILACLFWSIFTLTKMPFSSLFQGAINIAKPWANSQWRTTLCLRDMRKKLPTTCFISRSSKDPHRSVALLLWQMRKEISLQGKKYEGYKKGADNYSHNHMNKFILCLSSFLKSQI